ncbi:glycosyltransferase [Psychroserpens sp. SPM9]|uniref:glycosyltransferase n=1 Tax=Psychroserpens sp. SPM9 TaxID=2975598 RepID=UPI0021A4F491|nr:glycosyltransferase [Psychroserpens sp. SPM9]MDG5490129.1 glycosyltransferase [Psychroserpens sp. SPM9]
MKVLQVISGMGLKSGGPTTCTYNLLTGLIAQSVAVDLLTFDAESHDEIISRENFMKILPPPKHPRYGYSKVLKMWLKTHNDYELYHTNALWQYASHAAAKHAQKHNKPYVVSPHGMLYPEGLKKSKWFKKLALALFQKKDLIKATAFHATSTKEKSYIRDFGLSQPIAVIPNAIDVNAFSKNITEPHGDKRKIGFLGRLAPIKNLELLIHAWKNSNAANPDAELVIIGDGEVQYVDQLKALIAQKNIENITFTGFLSGKAQEEVMQQLSYLVLPSKSENFGMVVPEALAREIPVIASKGTPWEELETHQCGWWVESDLERLSTTLLEAIQLDETKRLKMGKNGRALVENKYSREAVSAMMTIFYEWILTDTKEIPSFVDIKA